MIRKKGKICLVSNNDEFYLGMTDDIDNDIKNNFSRFLLSSKFTNKKNWNYEDYYHNIVFKEIKEEKLNFLTRKMNIIYDEFIGDDGNKYGKELISGYVFPIGDNNSIEIGDLSLKYYDYKEINCRKLYFTINFKFENNSMSKVSSCIVEDRVADKNDVDAYLKKYGNKIIKIKRNNFIKTIEMLYNSNVFSREVKEKDSDRDKMLDKLKGINNDEKHKVLEDIEYTMFMLNDNDRKLLQKEYDDLLSKISGSITDDDLINLLKLKSKIELKVLFSKKNANDIFECIDSYKKDYLSKIGTDNKTNITFKEINDFFLLFNKVRDNYNEICQNEILKGFAFIYLMEIYENRDSTCLEELENTYVNDFIRTIIIIIKSLTSKDIGLFKNNLELVLRDNISLGELLDIIKNLELNIDNKDRYLESLSVKKHVLINQGI